MKNRLLVFCELFFFGAGVFGCSAGSQTASDIDVYDSTRNVSLREAIEIAEKEFQSRDTSINEYKVDYYKLGEKTVVIFTRKKDPAPDDYIEIIVLPDGSIDRDM